MFNMLHPRNIPLQSLLCLTLAATQSAWGQPADGNRGLDPNAPFRNVPFRNVVVEPEVDPVKQAALNQRAKLFAAPMEQSIPRPKAALPVDDYIMALATQSKTNFFCDVTDIAKETLFQVPPAAPATPNATLWIQVGDLMEQQGMTHLQMAPRTILMWQPPEPVTLGREILADWKSKQRSLASPPLKLAELRSAWRDYFQQLGWDGESKDVNLKVNLADVPLAARRRVLYEAYRGLFWGTTWDCFDDQLWPQAEVQVARSFYFSAEPVEPYLMLSQGHEETVETARGLAIGRTARGVPVGPISLINETRTEGAEEVSTASITPLAAVAANLPAKTRIQPLDEAGIKDDPRLAKPVAIELRRASLPELLQAMSQQSGIALRNGLSAEDSLSARRLTVKTENLALSETMLALSRLTGAVWTREGEIYTLQDNREDTLSFHLRQLGDPKAYRLRDNTIAKRKERFRRNAALVREVIQTIGLPELQNLEKPVPIGRLPQKLQDQLRRVAQEDALRALPLQALMAHDLLGSGINPNQPQENGLVLQLRQETGRLSLLWRPRETTASYGINYRGMRHGEDLTLTLRKSDGELVSSLFTNIKWIDSPAAPR